MQMDKTQRGWAFASLIIFLASAIGYVIYALNATPRPSGGSAVGLFFGIVGFGFMIFAALLGARKRVPVWRLGRAQAWMRGHLWLGLLSLPMILFHGAFHFGGAMTQVLMWLLIITVGVLFLIGEYTRFSFLELWPILLIVAGVVLTAQSLASKQGHLGS